MADTLVVKNIHSDLKNNQNPKKQLVILSTYKPKVILVK